MTIPYTENPAWADGSGGGTPINAAKLNAIEQGITDAHLMPAVQAYHSINQSIPHATDTIQQLNSENFDQVAGAASNMHDNATNNSRLTCRYAGVYHIIGQIQFAGHASGIRYAMIRLNATTRIAAVTHDGNATENNLIVATFRVLAVNDYVELQVHQTSGGDLNSNTTTHTPTFGMVRVA